MTGPFSVLYAERRCCSSQFRPMARRPRNHSPTRSRRKNLKLHDHDHHTSRAWCGTDFCHAPPQSCHVHCGRAFGCSSVEPLRPQYKIRPLGDQSQVRYGICQYSYGIPERDLRAIQSNSDNDSQSNDSVMWTAALLLGGDRCVWVPSIQQAPRQREHQVAWRAMDWAEAGQLGVYAECFWPRSSAGASYTQG